MTLPGGNVEGAATAAPGIDLSARVASRTVKREREDDLPAAGGAAAVGLSEARLGGNRTRHRDEPTELASRQSLLRQLQIEKQRTDRTKSPLSVIVFTLDRDRSADHAGFWQLLQLLSESKRVTDILGYLTDQKVVLLLPHTDAGGSEALIAIIRKRAGDLPVGVASATYPDEMFDNLMQDTQRACDSAELLFQVPLNNPPYIDGVLKRLIDVAGSMFGLILFSPIMLVTAVAIKATSPGPVIFRQARVGLRGRPFQFFKFRSMAVNSDDRIHREYVANLIEGKLDAINKGDVDRPLYKLRDDPRITKVGRFIRKTSIDELPQLWCVLKGEMSLVGPRPALEREVTRYSLDDRRRLEALPGLTCTWQVSGRSDIPFPEQLRMDVEYIEGQSLKQDVKLLLKTIPAVATGRGAY